MMRPSFSAGQNIAIKVPSHEYDKTVAFYRDVLGLEQFGTPDDAGTESARFRFGDKILWVDRVGGISQAEIWLEVVTDNLEQAAEYLERNHCVRRDEIEPLPPGFQGFWVSSPANIIHLVTKAET